jgi:IS30 family transposase
MYTHITHIEREHIGLLKAGRMKIPVIAKKLGRDPTTIRRELKRSKPWFLGYSPLTAESDADKKRRLPRRRRKLENPKLCTGPHSLDTKLVLS